MKNIKYYLTEGSLKNSIENLSSLIPRLEMEASRQRCKGVKFALNGGVLDITLSDSGFTFNAEVARACRAGGVQTVNVHGTPINRFDLVSAKNLNFNIEGSKVLFGGFYRLKADVTDCEIKCDHLKFEEGDVKPKVYKGVTINANVVEVPVGHSAKIVAGCDITTKVLTLDFITFKEYHFDDRLPSDVFDWKKMELKGNKKISWDPIEELPCPVDAEYIVFRPDTYNMNGKPEKLMPIFYRSSGGKFAGYKLRFEKAPVADSYDKIVNKLAK